MSASIDTTTDHHNEVTVSGDEIEKCPLRVTIAREEDPRVTTYIVHEGLSGSSEYSTEFFHFLKTDGEVYLDPRVHRIDRRNHGQSSAAALASLVLAVPGVLNGVVIGPYGVKVARDSVRLKDEVETSILEAIALHTQYEAEDLDLWLKEGPAAAAYHVPRTIIQS